MKKLFKTLAVCAVAGTLCAGIAVFSGCGAKEETYFGQYHYTNYGHEYGIAVNVTVKGDDIIKVEKVASNYVEVSAGWTEEGKTTWNNGINTLLAKYADKTVTEVKAATGTIDKIDSATANSVSDNDLLITGATQGSVRVLKAVQDALNNKKAAAKVVEGEYHYPNAWDATAPHYGIKVSVTVVDGTIFNVEKVASNYVEVTDSWTEEGKAIWNDGIDGLLDAYTGKTVEAVRAVTGTIKGVEDAEANALSDSTLLISGATQGSVRVLKAVQDALAKL